MSTYRKRCKICSANIWTPTPTDDLGNLHGYGGMNDKQNEMDHVGISQAMQNLLRKYLDAGPYNQMG